MGLEAEGGQRGLGGAVPDYVENDAGEGGVGVVAVGVPVGGAGIDLDVAGDGWIVADLNDGLVEVGAGLMVPESGVEHAHGAAVEGLEGVAMEALVLPDCLQQVLRRRAGRGVAQGARRVGGAPLGIKFGAGRFHLVARAVDFCEGGGVPPPRRAGAFSHGI